MSLASLPIDPELLIVLITVASIITLQILAVISFLCYRNYKGKARWLHLREEGIVLLDEPAMYWTDGLPMPPVPVQVDTLRLGQSSHASGHNLIPGPQGLATSQQNNATIER
ncbi:hypothetical protein E8E11_010517 [Didymella keratinophila]|nr:hypothetical protein E8E11_010517 [Didymella keratinophila]